VEEIETSSYELKKGRCLPSGKIYRITLPNLKLKLRFDIDPNKASSWDDKFTLYGNHERADYEDYCFKQEKTVRDDVKPQDEFLDIEFTDLRAGLYYWLEVDPGQEGEAYFLFQALSYSNLCDINE